ncbi:MAG TPA: ribosome recycling factor [Chloroflexota bacterium]|nr:ribosome recycling factor [Chloroflexota bacterium]
MIEDVLADAESRMSKAVEAERHHLVNIRTGRANPSVLENVQVQAYGANMPLIQLATISAPGARMLTIQPYDRSVIGDIERAILKSDLGFNPTNEGTIIRIVIPQLTEERRRDMVKVVHNRLEEARVAIRNVRRDAHDHLRKMLKEKEISEDEEDVAAEDLQHLTDRMIQQADALGATKESEMMEV